MELVEIFFVLGIIFMISWLLFLVILAVFLIKIRQAAETARVEFQRKKIEAERAVDKIGGLKILGILPIMPILAFVVRNLLFKRISRKRLF